MNIILAVILYILSGFYIAISIGTVTYYKTHVKSNVWYMHTYVLVITGSAAFITTVAILILGLTYQFESEEKVRKYIPIQEQLYKLK